MKDCSAALWDSSSDLQGGSPLCSETVKDRYSACLWQEQTNLMGGQTNANNFHLATEKWVVFQAWNNLRQMAFS